MAIRVAGLLFAIAALSAPPVNAQRLSDDEVRTMMIDESIRAYRGVCPCPYNLTRGGRRCGPLSAYSKPGGASPLCYKDDITAGMVDDYRRRKGLGPAR